MLAFPVKMWPQAETLVVAAALPLLWWRPQAATFVEAVNIVNIVAITTVLILHLSKTGGLSVGRIVDRIDGPSDGHTSERLC